MAKLSENTFERGINGDVDPKRQPSNTARRVSNMDIADENSFSALTNMKGTTPVVTLLSNATTGTLNILGLFPCRGVLDGTERDAQLAFVYSDGVSRIFAVDLELEKAYQLFPNASDPTADLAFPPEGSVDAYYNKERGENSVYFVDHKNEYRRIIVDSSVNQTLKDLVVRPLAASDYPEFISVQEGGNIESGSYQFTFRYYNINTNKASTWSALTNPIPVTPTTTSDVPATEDRKIVGGAVGDTTNKLINLKITQVDPAAKVGFNAIQLAVIKRVTGSEADETLAYRLSPSENHYNDPTLIQYNGSEVETAIGIEEITVEDAEILTFKTIEQKDNRIFGGNIIYNDLLDFDNGDPTFSDACTIAKKVGFGLFGNTGNILFANDVPSPGKVLVHLEGVDVTSELGVGLGDTIQVRHSGGEDDLTLDTPLSYGPTVLSTTPGTAFAAIGTITPGQSNYQIYVPREPYKEPEETVNRRGHFRDEVYRYGISYVDRFGNSSPVQVYDFSAFTRETVDASKSTYITNSITWDPNTSTIVVAGDATPDIAPYDVLKITAAGVDYGYFKVISSSTAVDYPGIPDETTIKIEGVQSAPSPAPPSAGSTISVTLGDKASHSKSGIDWKYPGRDVAEFSLLDEDDAVNALGLKISGIKNHPSWAVGFYITRMERSKNILFQTPHIPLSAYQGVATPGKDLSTNSDLLGPYRSQDSFTIVGVGQSNNLDHYGPKKHDMGGARHILRHSYDSGSSGPYQLPFYITQLKAGGDPRQAVPPVMLAIPPDYVFNNGGEPFLNYEGNASHNIRIVDAVALVKNEFVNANSGFSKALVFRAEGASGGLAGLFSSRAYYYYNREGFIEESSTPVYNRKISDNSYFSSDAVSESRVRFAFNEPVNHETVTFPEAPLPGNDMMDYIVQYGDGTDLSTQQGSDDSVTGSPTANINTRFGNPVENQRGILLWTDEAIQDFSTSMSREFDFNSVDFFPFVNLLQKANYVNIYDDNHLDIFPQPNVGNFTAPVRSNPATVNGRISSAAYVINVESGLPDNRYGDPDTKKSFISTGHFQPLTQADIDANTEFEAEIFGGDCFITKTAIKVNNASLLGVNYTPDSSGLDFTAPYNYKVGSYNDYVEIIELFVESEVNSGFGSETGVYPESETASASTYNTTYTYNYHPDYSDQNTPKLFFSRDKFVPNTTRFPSRTVYTDQKVYQSNIEGFDRFRSANLKDLEEQFGGITKLIKSNDSELWAIQEGAVRYVPVGKEIVELQDGVGLTVGSGTVIGNTVKYLTRESGSRHIRTVKFAGDRIYFVDSDHREVKVFASHGKVETVSDMGMYSYFKQNLEHNAEIPEKELMAGFDFNKEEYWVIYNGFTDEEKLPDGSTIPGVDSIPVVRDPFYVIYNERFESWKTEIDPGSKDIYAAGYAGKEFYLFSNEDNGGVDDFKLYTAYTNEQRGFLFGQYHDSEFDLIVNPDPNFAKTFDVITINAIEPLTEVDFEVINESALTPNQEATGVDLTNVNRQGMFYANQIRDDVRGGRLRGQYMVGKFRIENGIANNRNVRISGIITKYRESSRNY